MQDLPSVGRWNACVDTVIYLIKKWCHLVQEIKSKLNEVINFPTAKYSQICYNKSHW
jgi:hypothetical protein